MYNEVTAIIHVSPDHAKTYLSFGKPNSKVARVCRNILRIADHDNTMFIEDLWYIPPDPNLSHATLFLLGGGLEEICIASFEKTLDQEKYRHRRNPDLIISQSDFEAFVYDIPNFPDIFEERYWRARSI